MRRRLADANIGLGYSAKDIFDNKWTDNEKFNKAAKSFFDDVLLSIKDFSEFAGFDFTMTLRENGFQIIFGLEPTYKHDPFICYCLDSDKDKIFIHKGKANGYYGSDIVVNEELNYKEGMCTKEFKGCIDTHYDKLMECLGN